jgi:mannose-6-phosphate isomerase-like protein (cupin superfamily)
MKGARTVQEIMARRIIAGLNEAGRSSILEDGHTPTRVIRPNGAVVQELWRQISLPARPGDDGTRGTELELAPPDHGVVVRMYTCPPDHEADLEAYSAAAETIYGDGNAAASGSFPGMHRTQTLDINTVVAGEIYAVCEEGETLLRAGDCIVVPGTMRAWSNRTDAPATLVSTCFPLTD